jgi:hypothetical protein
MRLRLRLGKIITASRVQLAGSGTPYLQCTGIRALTCDDAPLPHVASAHSPRGRLFAPTRWAHPTALRRSLKRCRVRAEPVAQWVERNASSSRSGTAALWSSCAAVTTSSENPAEMSSRPLAQRCRASDTAPATASYPAPAASASGEIPAHPSARRAVTSAPAPHRSSTAGRRLPSGHRSPAAMIATARSGVDSRRRRSQSAAARRFRRLTPITEFADCASWKLIADPLGEGSTSRGSSSAARIVADDRLTWPSIACDRPTASTASRSSAYRAADSSLQRYGKTTVPRSAATVSVVVKLRTSTTTATSQPALTAIAPVDPQSRRSEKPGCR